VTLQPATAPRFLIGLDLGQAQDPTALAVVHANGEQCFAQGTTAADQYTVPHLERFTLGTSYPKIVERVLELLVQRQPGRDTQPLRHCKLVVDRTGVGRAVVDLFKEVLPKTVPMVAVTITAGHHATFVAADGWNVPKKELVGVLQALLQTRRMKIAKDLPNAQVLAQELANFQVKLTAAANETFGAWREGQHDDLVLALAIAAWVAERGRPQQSFAPKVVGGTSPRRRLDTAW
jgi:hypothetical protein